MTLKTIQNQNLPNPRQEKHQIYQNNPTHPRKIEAVRKQVIKRVTKQMTKKATKIHEVPILIYHLLDLPFLLEERLMKENLPQLLHEVNEVIPNSSAKKPIQNPTENHPMLWIVYPILKATVLYQLPQIALNARNPTKPRNFAPNVASVLDNQQPRLLEILLSSAECVNTQMTV